MAESVVRGRRKGFTMIYNSVLKDPRLDLKTKGFFAVMMSFPDEWEYTVKGLAQVMQIGKDAVRSCLKQLEEAGYLMREQSRQGGRFSQNVYVLLEESASPLSDLPYTVKPSTDLPCTVNPTQYKTIENKDNNNIPPISPTGEGEEGHFSGGKRSPEAVLDEKDGLIPKHKPERFMKLWAIWPKKRRKARKDAVKAWDRLKASDELLDRMAEALHRQMQSEDWKKGIGVPYPSTWLNGRRWEDETEDETEDPADEPEETGGWAEDEEVI